MANYYEKFNMFSLAAKYFDKAAQVAFQDPNVAFEVVKFYERQKLYFEAKDCINKCLKFNKTCSKAHRMNFYYSVKVLLREIEDDFNSDIWVHESLLSFQFLIQNDPTPRICIEYVLFRKSSCRKLIEQFLFCSDLSKIIQFTQK